MTRLILASTPCSASLHRIDRNQVAVAELAEAGAQEPILDDQVAATQRALLPRGGGELAGGIGGP